VAVIGTCRRNMQCNVWMCAETADLKLSTHSAVNYSCSTLIESTNDSVCSLRSAVCRAATGSPFKDRLETVAFVVETATIDENSLLATHRELCGCLFATALPLSHMQQPISLRVYINTMLMLAARSVYCMYSTTISQHSSYTLLASVSDVHTALLYFESIMQYATASCYCSLC
jgi:hypothetical protein